MTLSNEEIATMIDLMTSLEETGKLGYAIAYNMRKMREEAKEYLDLKGKLLQKYGKPVNNGYVLNDRDNPEGFKEYIKEMGDIPNIEHDIDIFTITPEEFYSGNLTSVQMANLMWMVKDEPKKGKGEEA